MEHNFKLQTGFSRHPTTAGRFKNVEETLENSLNKTRSVRLTLTESTDLMLQNLTQNLISDETVPLTVFSDRLNL